MSQPSTNPRATREQVFARIRDADNDAVGDSFFNAAVAVQEATDSHYVKFAVGASYHRSTGCFNSGEHLAFDAVPLELADSELAAVALHEIAVFEVMSTMAGASVAAPPSEGDRAAVWGPLNDWLRRFRQDALAGKERLLTLDPGTHPLYGVAGELASAARRAAPAGVEARDIGEVAGWALDGAHRPSALGQSVSAAGCVMHFLEGLNPDPSHVGVVSAMEGMVVQLPADAHCLQRCDQAAKRIYNAAGQTHNAALSLRERVDMQRRFR